MEPFKLERYFAQFEFKVKYLLSPSDCESYAMDELLSLADPEGLKLWQELRFSYTESLGHPLLRQEISHLYQKINPDNILISAPEEAIYIAMNTMLKQGDHLIALFPAYQSLYELARTLGCEVTLWPLKLDEQGWKLDMPLLEQSIKPNTRMLVINFPHNPTGYLPSKAELQAILDLACRHDLFVFSDEMYRFLEVDPSDRLPAVCDQYEKGITLSGLSKSFALPGLRIGWLATQDSGCIPPWLAFKDYTTICSSAPSEILGIIALRANEKVLSRSRKIVLNNIKSASDFFAQYPHQFKWLPPKGGSIAFPQWLGSMSVDQFCQEVLDQQGVMIVPGSIFDYPGNHFRIGLGRINLPQALERVGDYLTPDKNKSLN